MKILIENNSFTMDTREARISRLDLLQNNINKYAKEINISHELLDWALYSYEEFLYLTDKFNEITIKKNESFNLISTIEREFFQKFNSFKDLVLSQYKNQNVFDEDDTQLPTTRIDKIEFSSDFINKVRTNSKIKIDKMTQGVIDLLIPMLDEVRNTYGSALNYKEEQTNLSNRIKKRFNQDSLNLRSLYSLCIVYWSKKEAKLLDLGFALPKLSFKNKNTPNNTSRLIVKNSIVHWEKDVNAQSYQLVFRNRFNSVDWQIIYEGNELKSPIDIKQGEFKVRGLNFNGFGPWSESIFYNENNELI